MRKWTASEGRFIFEISADGDIVVDVRYPHSVQRAQTKRTPPFGSSSTSSTPFVGFASQRPVLFLFFYSIIITFSAIWLIDWFSFFAASVLFTYLFFKWMSEFHFHIHFLHLKSFSDKTNEEKNNNNKKNVVLPPNSLMVVCSSDQQSAVRLAPAFTGLHLVFSLEFYEGGISTFSLFTRSQIGCNIWIVIFENIQTRGAEFFLEVFVLLYPWYISFFYLFISFYFLVFTWTYF